MANNVPIDFAKVKEQLTCKRVLMSEGWQAVSEFRDTVRGPCPLHRSRSKRSRSMALTGPVWYCHYCKRGGDVIDLWAEMRSLTLLEAAHDLVNRFCLRVQTFMYPGFGGKRDSARVQTPYPSRGKREADPKNLDKRV